MTQQLPTVGRIVFYHPTEEEKKEMHKKKKCNESDVLPGIIVKNWSDPKAEDACLNIQVFLDGEGCLWKTSVNKGDKPGQWNWPPRV